MADTQQFSFTEFNRRVFKEDGIDKEFLLKVINQICIDRAFTPLHWAIMNNDMDLFKYLIDHGADPTITGNEVVREAVISGNLEAVQYLHEHGVDVAKDDKAMRIAAKHGHVKVLTYIEHTFTPRNRTYVPTFSKPCG